MVKDKLRSVYDSIHQLFVYEYDAKKEERVKNTAKWDNPIITGCLYKVYL